MLLRTHLAAAGIAGLALASPHHVIPGLAAALVGGAVPDLDLVPFRNLSTSPFQSSPIRHRGLTHSLLFLALTAPLAYIAGRPFRDSLGTATAYAAGLLSHVLLDALTRSPVHPLWPASYSLHLPSLVALPGIRTGGLVDRTLGFALALGLLALLAFRFSTFLAEFSVH